MKLVVTHAFANYNIGDEITEPEAVAAFLASEQAQYVVKVADTPATQPKIPAK